LDYLSGSIPFVDDQYFVANAGLDHIYGDIVVTIGFTLQV
jgi:hypothetical protein